MQPDISLIHSGGTNPGKHGKGVCTAVPRQAPVTELLEDAICSAQVEEAPVWHMPGGTSLYCTTGRTPLCLRHELLGEDIPGLEGHIAAHGRQEARPVEGDLRGGCQSHASDNRYEGCDDGQRGGVPQEQAGQQHAEEGLHGLHVRQHRYCICIPLEHYGIMLHEQDLLVPLDGLLLTP